MDNFSSLTASMREERETLRSVIRNANKITTELTNSRLTETFTNLNTMSEKLAQAPINETITNLDQMSLHLNEIAQKINTNQGSLGMLVHDKDLYNNLTKTLEELARLTEDLKKHPSRYVNLTIFGRKAQPAAN
jgi:phospholipid/cholesterol/gamma-HCH transport system substrate-binding protein